MRQNFLQILRLVCQFPIILLKKLIGVMEIDHFSWSIETFHHVLKQNVHNILQKRQSGPFSVTGWQQVWRTEREREGHSTFHYAKIQAITERAILLWTDLISTVIAVLRKLK